MSNDIKGSLRCLHDREDMLMYSNAGLFFEKVANFSGGTMPGCNYYAVIASYVREPTRRLFGQFGSEAFRTGQLITPYFLGQSVRILRSTSIVATSEYFHFDISLSINLKYERK